METTFPFSWRAQALSRLSSYFHAAVPLHADQTQVAGSCAVAGTGAQSTHAFAKVLVEVKQAKGFGIAKLERIGWQHIAMARESFDPGFYLLAEQTARCKQNHAPDSKEALLLLGHALHNQRRLEDARRGARQLVNDRGTWFDYGLLGDVLTNLGELDGAVSAYDGNWRTVAICVTGIQYRCGIGAALHRGRGNARHICADPVALLPLGGSQWWFRAVGTARSGLVSAARLIA